MKKYISNSLNLLAISFQIKDLQNVAAEGEEEDIQEVTITKEVVMSKGTVAELPEDNERVKDLLIKGHIKVYTAPSN